MTYHASIDTVIFDVGGVLVELSGVQQMLAWCRGRLSEAELWPLWLASPAVRAFESGRCDAATFGAEVVREFGLNVGPAEYLAAFERWPRALFPGAAELLRSLSPRPQLISLSNTNALHWNYVCDELGLGPLFDRHFPSHETGLMKPDHEVFDFVVQSLCGSAERMLFLDDNPLNVAAARAAGMQACRVAGIEQTAAQLRNLGFQTSEPLMERGS
jgi:putative hydrolase of the HAD superfamily